MEQYENFFTRVKKLKEMGGLEEALQILLLMQEKIPEERNRIELEILEVKYQQQLYKEALIEALAYLQEDDGRIWQWVEKKYRKPFLEDYYNIKKINESRLKDYKYFYGSMDNSDIEIIWYDENGCLIFKKGNQLQIYSEEFSLDTDELIIIMNPLNLKKLLTYKKRTEYSGNLPKFKKPVYVYFHQDVFNALVQCTNLEELMYGERVVFLIGEDNLKNFFSDLDVIMPAGLKGDHPDEIRTIIEQIIEQKEYRYKQNMQRLLAYYSQASNEIKERIVSGKPKIMFLTSYFTTVLQYHTRDCKRAADEMGLQTKLIIETNPIFQVCNAKIVQCMNDFRPDIIFCIDHFRFEREIYPKEIVWISWLQDILPKIMSCDTPKKLGNRDFVLNHFITWSEFKQIGYPSELLIDAPIPANDKIYKKYTLNEQEYEKFACDLCFVCHGSDVDKHIVDFVKSNKMDAKMTDMLFMIYKGYQSYVYESGSIFYNKQLFVEFVEGSFIQQFKVQVKPEAIEHIANDMYLWFNQRVYRQALVDWILDAGFTNIKLWGNGWLDSEKYRAYAMGPAENGETLSKIYQASKIVIGNNIMTTSAARAWETMLSGGFYLSNYIPEEDDVTDIRKIIEVDKDVVMFYGKDDLIEKIRYYLEHEQERKIMIERGRKAALEKMTFEKLMKRTLSEIAKRLKENDNG